MDFASHSELRAWPSILMGTTAVPLNPVVQRSLNDLMWRRFRLRSADGGTSARDNNEQAARGLEKAPARSQGLGT